MGPAPEVRDQLHVLIRADWAVFDDPIRSPVLSHDDEQVLVAEFERKWLQDSLLYFSAVGLGRGRGHRPLIHGDLHATRFARLLAEFNQRFGGSSGVS